MKSFSLYLSRWTAWAPGLETVQAVQSWGRGETEIRKTSETPALEFLPSLFRRRLSQLSKMVLHIGHTLIPAEKQTPCVFASHYGEINKQYKISKQLIDTQEVSPAVFSLSVFNAPAFLLSIAEGNNETSSAVYSGDQCLVVAFLEMIGFLQSNTGKDCMVIFADENIPPAYHSLFSSIPEPYALGVLFSSTSLPGSRACTIEINSSANNTSPEHPLCFLRWLATDSQDPFSCHASGIKMMLRTNPS
ncbi:MAG: beta-ketoacyl synthase chain length factor [Spirochaetales bacterium]|nr:beta-ketoacyl synthase chain length factor [Spirochaetales bacterium]